MSNATHLLRLSCGRPMSMLGTIKTIWRSRGSVPYELNHITTAAGVISYICVQEPIEFVLSSCDSPTAWLLYYVENNYRKGTDVFKDMTKGRPRTFDIRPI